MADPRTTHSQSAAQRQPYDDVILNRYRIMSASGTGGFGTVLTCWDTRLQRRVAIKRLPLTGTGASASSTLGEALAEARTSSLLAHPNIVTVYDFEVEGPYAYLVMEYVDGLTLSELLSRVEGGVLTHDEAACLVQSVASALGYAHENGVLHMDIKPTNIMVDRTGTVKLCDFGMATLASAAGYGGARGGTVGYMPPEQIEGDLVDERTDVFSLAVVVWQALLGASPFAAPTPEKSLSLILKGPGKPSKQDPALAGMVEEALLGAMAPSPSARIPSVETLAKELVFALGDPTTGAESLRNLVLQIPGQPDQDPEDWDGERLPLSISHPWVPKAFVRLLSTGMVLYLVWPLVASLLGDQPTVAYGVTGACGLATALWPPLGALLAGFGLCIAIALHAVDAAPMLLAIVMAVVLLAWWATCATRSNLSTVAAFLPACLGSPIAGVAVAGTALGPARALCTASVGWFLGRIWPLAAVSGFSLNGLVDALLLPLASGPTLLTLSGCAVAAAICSAITWLGTSTTHAVVGQVLGCAVLVGSQLVAARMENGGIWVDPSWDNTGIAVLLSVLVCIACVIHGPREQDLESEG